MEEVITEIPRLENWAPIGLSFALVNPESALRVRGRVYGRPLYRDGDMIHSSTIAGINSEGHLVTTTGVCYELGELDPDYAASYPNALSRLLKKIPRI